MTVNSLTATHYGDNTFAKEGISLSDGNNTFTAIGQDSSGRSATHSVTVNLPATVSFTYDANGNLTWDGEKSLAYTDENRLSNITFTNKWKQEFTYDGFSRRRTAKDYTWRNTSWVLSVEIRYIYDGAVPMQQRNADNAVLFTHDPSFLARTEDEKPFFYTRDGNQNITATHDSKQKIAEKRAYNPFGGLLGRTSVASRSYGSSGQEEDTPSGITSYLFREYNPSLQRWHTMDPLGPAESPNAYLPMRNNLADYIDMWGLLNYQWHIKWRTYDQRRFPGGGMQAPYFEGGEVQYHIEDYPVDEDWTTFYCGVELTPITVHFTMELDPPGPYKPVWWPGGMDWDAIGLVIVIGHELQHAKVYQDF